MNQKLKQDIRIIKYQDYIRRKPDRPFGYYGLGTQYLISDMTGLADKMFVQALKKKPDYVPAMTGKIDVLLRTGKYLAAARYYQKNINIFQRKKVYSLRVHQTASNIYSLRCFSAHLGKLRSSFAFDGKIGVLWKMFSRNSNNPVVNILLAMYCLKNGKSDDKALMLYNLCVKMDGIGDRLRWDLLQAISKKQPAILKDFKIAGLFKSIPENAYGTEYANLLLSCFIARQDLDRVNLALSEFCKRHVMPGKKVMWEYINFCSINNIWNSVVASCCQHLITECGWINSLLSHAAFQLKNKGIVDSDNRMFDIISLYGYKEA